MEKICRGKRPSEEQKQFLITYLEENLDLAHDRCKHREAEWRKLANRLNTIGGAFKDSTKWRKFWTDLRLHTKNNAKKVKETNNRSGINGEGVKPLTDLEERIIKIINYRNIEDDCNTEDLGFEPIDENMTNFIEKEEPDPSTSRERASSSTVLLHASPQTVQETSMASKPEPSSSRSRPQRPTRLRRRQRSNEINSNKILSIEEKKVLLKEEEIKLKKEELELRKLDLKEKQEINKTLKEILDCLKNNRN